MSFSRVTEEQTLEISRDGSVRFEKSNILDTEETRELLSPDASVCYNTYMRTIIYFLL